MPTIKAEPKPVNPNLVWPAPPETARIAYVQSFSRPEDLGIRHGFWHRVKSLLMGESDERLVRPMAVTVSAGKVFVADPGVRGIHRFNPGGDYRLINVADGVGFTSPVGLAVCGKELLATDSSRAQVLMLPLVGVKDDAEMVSLKLAVPLHQPTGIACDERGRIFVADTAAHEIKVFRRGPDRTATLETVLGKRGAGKGEFNFPTYLWRSAEGKLFVSDVLNFRVQVFDEQLHPIAQFGKLGDGSGDAARQKGVATDAMGHVYVVDGLFHAFQIFDDKGSYLLSVGTRGGESGEFWLPAGIFVDRDDRIYVTDSYNGRVQVFRYMGVAP
ncbi:MAG TPA: 6-bladed beta-propeller [Rhodocyclaceae bacterium]|nr:6-bladed beta-propeller [Rhodocyclaceae bacterium]